MRPTNEEEYLPVRGEDEGDENTNLQLDDLDIEASQKDEAEDQSSEEQQGNFPDRGWSWVLLVTAVASAMFFYCLDKSVTTILIPVIVGELGEASKLPWIFVGFGLGSLSLTLPIGKIYSLFDAKKLYLFFLSIFILGSGLCGAAWNMNTLICGRVLAGVGGIGIYTGIMTILTAVTTEKERPVYLGMIGLFWSIGRVIGPFFGGLLGKSSWRWAFYINLLVCGLFAPVYIFLLPNLSPSPKIPLRSRFQAFDILGTMLSIGTMVSIFTGTNMGGTQYPWNSPTMLLTLGCAVVFLLSFIVQQATSFGTTPKDRIFPVKMISNPQVCLIFIIGSTSSIAGFMPTNFISLYFQFTRGDSALDAALRLLPMIITMSIVLPLSGWGVTKVGGIKWWPVVGSVVALPGMIILSSLEVTTNAKMVYVSEALIGIGMGSYLQLPYTLVGSYISPSEKKEAMAFIIISQIGAIAFSMATTTALFTNLATSWLSKLLPDSSFAEIEASLSGTNGSLLKSLPEDKVVEVLKILVAAMRPAWLIGILSVIAGFGAAIMLIVS